MNCSPFRICVSIFLAFCFITTAFPSGASAQRVRISRGERDLVISKLGQLEKLVTIHFYTGRGNVNKTDRTSALLEFMREKSDNIAIVEHDMEKIPSLKSDLGVDHGPVMALKGDKFRGHSYYGLPSQLELEPFLDGILIAAGQGPELSDQAAGFLSTLEKEVHLRVFVTPD